MRKVPLLILASAAVAVLHYSPASAQVAVPMPGMPSSADVLDCSTALDAIEYFCQHRNQFNKDGQWMGPGRAVVAANPMPSPNVATTGSTTRKHHATRKPAHRTQHPQQ
jgi:hypothetical protein